MMNSKEFVKKCVDVAENYKTLYVMGCFGAPIKSNNVSRYCTNHSYNQRAERTAMIKNAADQDPIIFGFDCCNLIKGILWGWCGNANAIYGGAKYVSQGVPDIGADTIIQRCKGVSTSGWDKMTAGEALWSPGHIGVYIGNGLAVECTPRWKNCVQITAVGNIGGKSGYNCRTWHKHGKLPYITYEEEKAAEESTKPEKKPDTEETQKPDEISVGDVVKFVGKGHFRTAYAKTGVKAKTGKAKVTAIKHGTQHPYHLVATSGSRSNVYGWVNADDIEKE